MIPLMMWVRQMLDELKTLIIHKLDVDDFLMMLATFNRHGFHFA